MKLLINTLYTVHALFLLLLLTQPHFTPPVKKHKTLLVNTITPKQIVSTVSTTTGKKTPIPTSTPSKSSTTKKTIPKTTSPSSPPKPTTPTVTSKSSSSKTPPSSPPQPAPIPDALLQELEESIAKIERKGDKQLQMRPSLFAPLTLQIDTAEEGSYVEKLVGQLRATLQLPEYGDVKIQLNLRQDGSIVKLVVLKSQSKENKRYLEENLPLIRFPASGQELSFTLTFVNEL